MDAAVSIRVSCSRRLLAFSITTFVIELGLPVIDCMFAKVRRGPEIGKSKRARVRAVAPIHQSSPFVNLTSTHHHTHRYLRTIATTILCDFRCPGYVKHLTGGIVGGGLGGATGLGTRGRPLHTTYRKSTSKTQGHLRNHSPCDIHHSTSLYRGHEPGAIALVDHSFHSPRPSHSPWTITQTTGSYREATTRCQHHCRLRAVRHLLRSQENERTAMIRCRP